MILAPKLRHRITLQVQTHTQDATTGEDVVTWSNWLADEPADVVPLSGKEFLQSASTQTQVDTRMTIRWRAGVLSTMRVVFDEDNYNVSVVLPDPTNRRWLTLMAYRVVNDGV